MEGTVKSHNTIPLCIFSMVFAEILAIYTRLYVIASVVIDFHITYCCVGVHRGKIKLACLNGFNVYQHIKDMQTIGHSVRFTPANGLGFLSWRSPIHVLTEVDVP